MPHHYRITVDRLDAPGEEGLESMSFFAATRNDLFTEANRLRHALGCSACAATQLALGRGLVSEAPVEFKAPSAAARS